MKFDLLNQCTQETIVLKTVNFSFPHNDRWRLSTRQKNKECPNTWLWIYPLLLRKKYIKITFIILNKKIFFSIKNYKKKKKKESSAASPFTCIQTKFICLYLFLDKWTDTTCCFRLLVIKSCSWSALSLPCSYKEMLALGHVLIY